MYESHDIFCRVRGREQMKETTRPTTPKTIEQVPWLVIEFIATVNVRIWLAIIKTRNNI